LSPHADIIEWKEARDIFEVFTIFVNEPELRWFEKVWKGFIDMGLASYGNDTERHWVLARIITIGIMFDEFCFKAWEEHTDTDSLILELQDEEFFNHIRLGSMVDREYLSEDEDEPDLFVKAIDYLVHECRIKVFDALCKIFGGVSILFVSLWLSMDESIEIGSYSDEQLDSVLNDSTVDKMCAFVYVNNGMFSLDS
jgi:hypothetical protein